MRGIIFLTSMALVPMTGMAQSKWSITPKAGVNIAMLGGEGGKESSVKVGFAIGGEAEYWEGDRTGFSIGLLYSQEGASETEKGITAHLNLHYLNLPLLVNLHLLEGLTIKMGVQASLLLKSTVSATQDNVSISLNVGEAFKDYALAIPIGLSYEYKRFVLDARYNIGILSIVKDQHTTMGDATITSSTSSTTSNVAQITLGYRFSLKDRRKK